jgi:hypothetical protein
VRKRTARRLAIKATCRDLQAIVCDAALVQNGVASGRMTNRRDIIELKRLPPNSSVERINSVYMNRRLHQVFVCFDAQD